MKRATSLLCMVLMTAPGVARAQFHTVLDDLEEFPVDTSPGYVKRLTAFIQDAQKKHQAIITTGDSGFVPLDAQALAAFDLATVERYDRWSASAVQEDTTFFKQFGPDAKNGVVLLRTNVKRVSTMIKTAQEKHMVIVLDDKVVDTAAVAALDPSKIAHAAMYDHADGTAATMYGPDAKNGLLVLTTRVHQ